MLSCHTVLNPDLSSEVQLLGKYGPDVPAALLRRVAAIFHELRGLADSGDLAYPFSTREAVSLIKHMEAYKEEHSRLPHEDTKATMYTIKEAFPGIPGM